jgi:hypothetical protein
VLSNREAQVSQDILRLATAVAGSAETRDEENGKVSQQRKSLFAWR